MFVHSRIETLGQAIDAKQTKEVELNLVKAFSLLTTDERVLIDDSLVEDAYPLTMLQQGMVFHNLIEEREGTYHDVFSFKLKSEWCPELFKEAFTRLASQHNSLRSLFLIGEERPLQLIYTEIDLPLVVCDLQHKESIIK